MGRGSQPATAAANQGNALSGQAAANSGALYGQLAPQLQAEAANPQGFTPTTMAAMNTSSMQGAGGSNAGAVGQGSLLASRTRNAGTADAAIGQSVRSSGQQLGADNLKTQLSNQELKQHEMQEGISGLGNLYSTNMGQATGALGAVAQNVNANTEAQNASWNWAKYLLDPAMSGAASAARLGG